ncbi:HhH-GPD family protein [Candidatus Magnetomorum sp. HK-1]|nr:HhH-GPD family protein [Candidatus Magnetomorum sp. HK-1]
MKAKGSSLQHCYQILLNHYGPQGWWPLLDVQSMKTGKPGTFTGYHPGDYSFPQTEQQQFEICIGAILTQNTAWKNVEKALNCLHENKAISARIIDQMDMDQLKSYIRSAGYYNQKAKKLKLFSKYYLSLRGKTPTRNELLSVWGIGPETADSILLYAFNVPIFVIDTYTKRIFSSILKFDSKTKYETIQSHFENQLERDVIIFQEYHALIVEHAKHYYMKKKTSENDPLLGERGKHGKPHL